MPCRRRKSKAPFSALCAGRPQASEAIARTCRQIELVREYRTTLIAAVVTGKLDVREAAAQLPDEADDQDPMEEDGLLADDLPSDLYDIAGSVEDSVVEEEVSA